MQAQRIDLTGVHATLVLVKLREKPNGVADSTLARMLRTGSEGGRYLAFALDRLNAKGYRTQLHGDARGCCKRRLISDPKVTLWDSSYGAEANPGDWTPKGWRR